jgi:hypothetical protein
MQNLERGTFYSGFCILIVSTWGGARVADWDRLLSGCRG